MGANIIEPKKNTSHRKAKASVELCVMKGTGIPEMAASRPTMTQRTKERGLLYPPTQLKRTMPRKTPKRGAEMQVTEKKRNIWPSFKSKIVFR